MNRLKELREEKHLSLRALEEQTGIGNQLISNYEREKKEPSFENWYKLALFFGVSVDYLKGKSDDKEVNFKNIQQPVGNYYLINNLARTYLRLAQLEDGSYLNSFEEILYALDIASKQSTYENNDFEKHKNQVLTDTLEDIQINIKKIQDLY